MRGRLRTAELRALPGQIRPLRFTDPRSSQPIAWITGSRIVLMAEVRITGPVNRGAKLFRAGAAQGHKRSYLFCLLLNCCHRSSARARQSPSACGTLMRQRKTRLPLQPGRGARGLSPIASPAQRGGFWPADLRSRWDLRGGRRNHGSVRFAVTCPPRLARHDRIGGGDMCANWLSFNFFHFPP